MSQLKIDAKTVQVDNETYRISMLDPITSANLLVDILDIVGPSLGVVGSSILKAKNSKEAVRQLMDGIEDGEGIEDLIGEGLEKAITGLVNRLSKEKQLEIINSMKSVTEVKKGDDKWPSLDSVFTVHFRGRVKHMYKWLAAALKVQYGDFF